MLLAAHRIAPFNRFTVSSRECLQILVCCAHTTVTLPPGLAGLWWPMRGQGVVLSGDWRVVLDKRSAYVSDHKRAHDISIARSSLLLGLVGPPHVWGSIVPAAGAARVGAEPALYPALQAVNASVARRLVQLARNAATCELTAIGAPQASLLGAIVAELQEPVATMIARCPGSSVAQKRAVFLRLQRVRNHVAFCSATNLTVANLALMASYSVSRFIPVYCSVFGETPYAHISRCRVERAKEMLQSGEQCVADIALSVGFENRATLTRAIKRRFGVSARQLREFHRPKHATAVLAG